MDESRHIISGVLVGALLTVASTSSLAIVLLIVSFATSVLRVTATVVGSSVRPAFLPSGMEWQPRQFASFAAPISVVTGRQAATCPVQRRNATSSSKAVPFLGDLKYGLTHFALLNFLLRPDKRSPLGELFVLW